MALPGLPPVPLALLRHCGVPTAPLLGFSLVGHCVGAQDVLYGWRDAGAPSGTPWLPAVTGVPQGEHIFPYTLD